MALTSTERNRRSRRHRAGDHSLCDPARCDDAVHAVAVQVRGSRGEKLYAALCEGDRLGPAERVLAEEAGRLVDRLDRLHEHLQGRAWLRFDAGELAADGAVLVVVKVDQVLSEARQHQVALKQLVAELRQSGRATSRPSAGAEPAAGAGAAGKAAGLGDLTAKLAQRRSSSA